MRITPIERNLRKIVSAAVKSVMKSEQALTAARERRADLEREFRRAQRRDRTQQTAKSNREFQQALSRLEKQRETVKQRRTVATETRRAQRAAEKRLESFIKHDTNPYTGERYTHLFEKPDLSNVGQIVSESENMSYRKQVEIAREMKRKIERRIRSIRDVGKQYGADVPVSDAVQEYETGIKQLRPSDLDNFTTIAIFYDKLFNKQEFESGSIRDYRQFIEGVNEFENELSDSGMKTQDVKNFYRVLNLVKKYFPDYVEESETRKQIKMRLDAGYTWQDVYQQLQNWFGSTQQEIDKKQSAENIRRRTEMQEQARAARAEQKKREMIEKRGRK